MKKKYCDEVNEKHIWEMLEQYYQQYCYCAGECHCDASKTYTIAKCKKCGAVMDISEIQEELNK